MSSSPENYKSTEIRVLEGNAAGCCKCILKDWTGIAFRIPRELLPKNHKDKARKKLENACPELKGSGIYFLFGRTKIKENGEDVWKKCVYVGKGDFCEDHRKEETGVLRRVLQGHSGTIDEDWDEVVVIVSGSRENHKLDIDGLEKKFIDRILEILDAANYILRNGNKSRHIVPPHTHDTFIDYANIALRAFGYYVLENLNPVDPAPTPEPPKPPAPPKDELLLSLTYTPKDSEKTYTAKGKYISNKKFVVLKGSEICPTEIPSCPDRIRNIRKKYADKINSENILTSDIDDFTSPSTAAGFVCGSSRDGNVAWHDPKNKKKKLGKILAESRKADHPL